MRTNIEIDEKLMKQAMKATGLSTKKAVVEEALRRIVDLERQARTLEGMWGKFPDIGDDYKKMRGLPPAVDDRE